MTFDAKEISQVSGQPVELFEIIVGADIYRLTNNEDEVTLNSVTYVPERVERTALETGIEDRSQEIQITLPATHPFPQKYVNIIPSDRPTLRIFRYHRTDTPTPQVIQIFDGFIESVAFLEDGEVARLSALPATASAGREIPRFMYQGMCNHILYDTRCKIADSGVNKFTGSVDAIAADGKLTINGLFDATPRPNQWAASGHIEVSGDSRLILDMTGDVITIQLPFRIDVLNEACNVFAGCDHTMATCKAKFNNIINYGGFPFVPTKNPFETGID